MQETRIWWPHMTKLTSSKLRDSLAGLKRNKLPLSPSSQTGRSLGVSKALATLTCRSWRGSIQTSTHTAWPRAATVSSLSTPSYTRCSACFRVRKYLTLTTAYMNITHGSHQDSYRSLWWTKIYIQGLSMVKLKFKIDKPNFLHEGWKSFDLFSRSGMTLRQLSSMKLISTGKCKDSSTYAPQKM